MNYRVIATLGPASATEIDWQAMLAAGASDFRLNTSHISVETLTEWLTTLNAFQSNKPGRQVPVILDLQGIY